MRNGTRKSKKTAPILCAALVIAILGIYLGVFLGSLLGELYGEVLAVGILIVYGLLIVAVILGVLAPLRQRLKEIESGEEEDAKQY